jgi:23S rRNA (uridine2552-2'-O)-methyltransferase
VLYNWLFLMLYFYFCSGKRVFKTPDSALWGQKSPHSRFGVHRPSRLTRSALLLLRIPMCAYERKDHFYRKAKREGKASRAVYKLAELQRRFCIVKRGDTVLDLGCAPGGWLQELSPLVGKEGSVIGIDLLPLSISPPPRCRFIRGDITDATAQDTTAALCGGAVDVVLSDLSPNLSGIAFADAYRSYELAMLSLSVCERLLRDDGNFLVKIFPGDEFAAFVAALKKRFATVTTVTPEATRKTSSERYIVCLGFKR